MKAPNFKYVAPSTLDAAVEILNDSEHQVQLLAGGQSLLPALNMRLQAPDILLDIKNLQSLYGIDFVGDSVVRVGSLTRHRDLEDSPIIAKSVPLLARAIKHVAHPAIRNRGTIGGSVALGDPAAELPACVVALDANIGVTGPAGERVIKASDFYHGLFHNDLGVGEIITHFDFEIDKPGWYSGFDEITRRRGDFATVGLAARINLVGDTIDNGKVIFFGVGEFPVSAKRTWESMVGQTLTKNLITASQHILSEDIDPQGDIVASSHMRSRLANILFKRVMDDIIQQKEASK
ncbi:MAG: xanthine dehydrogenase family protein subunit M [Candidatus Cloacimonetes bacterium]|nr:xanthine dehydrogenase family protein subunit M [Candidatus Cloacimonadota bacterium]MCK9515591.1 xanthine dehydrogenase family protein subunit M [Ottowia sp.]